jgi:Helitron helicase-like domain at N-terminus
MTDPVEATKADQIKVKINSKFDGLYRITESGRFEPYVCLICDEFIKPDSVERLGIDLLKSNREQLLPSSMWNPISSDTDIDNSLAECYRFTRYCGDAVVAETCIQGMCLSPRACYLPPTTNTDHRQKGGFTVCSGCKHSLEQHCMPKYAISNNYYFGTPPSCLLELTEIELAMLTPVKTCGYCFGYTGGVQKQLKGSLSYYKVEIASIIRGVSHLQVLGLNDAVVVLLYGNMTLDQQKRARQKNKIRVDYVLRAMQWLIDHNIEWKKLNLNVDTIKDSLKNPIMIDNSTTESTAANNNNIEKTESFQVFFPDGTLSSLTGGQESMQQFQKLVKSAREKGYDLNFQCDLMKEAVSDYKDNTLANACLLQFPYGRGGMNELRQKTNGSLTSAVDITEYVEHLSYVSQPNFHTALFSLILYNLTMKQRMVKYAGCQIRDKVNASALAHDLTVDDMTHAINARQSGIRSNNDLSVASHFLSKVDAVTRAAPHSNEAAKYAKRNAEAIQHRFGMASYFLTVTPDDDSSFLVQVYSGVCIDDKHAVASLSDEELSSRAQKRTQLRIKYPGICAYFFDLMLNIVITEVIGWDLKKQVATSEGLFGIPEAFICAVEEQGRTTLHAHFEIWIKDFNEIRNQLYDSNKATQKTASIVLSESMDKVASCCLYPAKSIHQLTNRHETFPHACNTNVHLQHRQVPKPVDDQQLRNLRYKEQQGMLAYCPHCTVSWTSEQLVESFLKTIVKVPGLTEFPDGTAKRLKATARWFL